MKLNDWCIRSLQGMLLWQLAFAALTGHAQVVQLPSYRSFSSSGSVWVPDGGAAVLGGNQYSSSGSVRRGIGPFSNRSFGSSVGGSSLTASVQIIDLDALDAAILESGTPASAVLPPSAPAAGNPVAANAVATASRSAAAATAKPVHRAAQQSYTVDYLRPGSGSNAGAWQRALSGSGSRTSESLGSGNASGLLEEDIRYYLQQARAAEKEGRLLSARVYYRMVQDAMTPELTERYQRIVAAGQADEEARLKVDADAGRRKF